MLYNKNRYVRVVINNFIKIIINMDFAVINVLKIYIKNDIYIYIYKYYIIIIVYYIYIYINIFL